MTPSLNLPSADWPSATPEPSVAAREELTQLLALVIALCDEAVEHQHAKNADGAVIPARLQDARDRLRSLTAARRELDG